MKSTEHNTSLQLQFGAPYSIVLFIFGIGMNMRLLDHYKIDWTGALKVQTSDIPNPVEVFKFATVLLLGLFFAFYLVVTKHVSLFTGNPHLAITVYSIIVVAIVMMPFNILHKKGRMTVVRKLGQCMWPYGIKFKLPSNETSFFEVLIADGLTSLSKPLQDICIEILMAFSIFSGQAHVDSYGEILKQYPVTYLVALLPYLLRMQQCLISSQHCHNANDKFLHHLNTLKYCSGALVILVGAIPFMWTNTYWHSNGTFFMLCACFNSVYSFFWDVVMDWGLGQPEMPKDRMLLRTKLIYGDSKRYYLAIVVDFILRLLWVGKWYVRWDWVGADFKIVGEICEVCRRCMWNIFRIEWQVIKNELRRKQSHEEKEMSLSKSEFEENEEKESVSLRLKSPPGVHKQEE